ncbi:hypothetical protein J3R82DRAFT_2195 [Butyriboletus roseoflavus]|nr:hypothetical protein J3R82DRAFT_2195 [Butyriboletus roseoflavus]
MVLKAISISRDHKRIVCGTEEGASVWNAELLEKVVDVDGTDEVWAVDVSPDSTTFATGTDKAVNIWRITSGERLVGPLKHVSYATGVRFSPNSERIATASVGGSIRIFDSRNGDELVTINTLTASTWPSTPLAWSNDGQQIFAASKDNKIKLFDVSTGSQLAESQTLQGSYVDCVALAANGKFIATFASMIISFLDTLTLSWIDPVIKDSEMIWAIAISPDNGYLATGLYDGKISIRDLGRILPDSYGPFHTSHHEERQPDEPSTSGGRDNKRSGSSPEDPRKSSTLESDIHSKDGDEDLLEEVASGAPPPEFNFDEPSSPGSSIHHEDDILPLDVSQAAAQLSDAMPAIHPPLTHTEEHLDTAESSHGITRFKKWVQMRTKKSNKDPTSQKPNRVARQPPRPADSQPPPQSSARVDPTHEGPSWIAAGQRVPRMVATSPGEPEPIFSSSLFARIRQVLQPKSPTEGAQASHANEDGSHTQGSANPEEVGPARPANDTSHPSAGVVHLTIASARIWQGYPQLEIFDHVSQVDVLWVSYWRWDALIRMIRFNMYSLASWRTCQWRKTLFVACLTRTTNPSLFGKCHHRPVDAPLHIPRNPANPNDHALH